jgi:hypothetical protein
MTTDREREALAFAEDLARKLFFDPDIATATPHLFARAVMVLEWGGRPIESLIKLAKAGNDDADRVLCWEAAHRLKKAQELGPLLTDYLFDILMKRFEEHKPKPSDSYKTRKVNLFIKGAVRLLEPSGLLPTRNRSLHGKVGRESRCSIVQKALARIANKNLTEASVEKSWEKSKKSKKSKSR